MMPAESYEQVIDRLTRALATGDLSAVSDLIPDDRHAEQMRLFAEENRDKRCDKLRTRLDLLADGFDDLDELLEEYAREQGQEALSEVTHDAERFLNWLDEKPTLTPQQRDYLACQKARHAVEFAAARHREAHLRFQERVSLAPELATELDEHRSFTIHLNPIRVWSRFQTTALLDEEAICPADVLFFARATDVHVALLDEQGRAAVEELATLSPCTLEEWIAWSQTASPDQLIELCRDLAEIGLISFT